MPPRALTFFLVTLVLGAAALPSTTPTFHKDIEPIFQARCQG
jgi:hypothetical protein